ncbi:hypothetical protein ACFYSH_19280 [Streptomyces sp. NPDC005791]|uniref:hypothetical protein n=1 Tax=unclassified Streptomyces TaxID=2593676 RepID=UPI0034092412
MLSPIDTDAVIRDGGVTGAFPDELHEAVAWWVAACFVVVGRVRQMAVAHDSHPITAGFYQRFCCGAINAQHFGCQVSSLGVADEAQLIHAMKRLGGVPGALLTTADVGGRQTVTIRLYDVDGRSVTEDTGLAGLRQMIVSDRVPLPVNDHAKGRIIERRDLVEAL